eukprot:CAMPEP_0118697768 /NCGR_PEP_ID=MMETSP0800-20121206/14742_1 /TAXON_ID=210618 ORGANISM="Striatella unipunctata, Strain CCMP2910" /NCGR_SAMPLE_ID=MMETSP0800 /ASSEMBLY_ACC=CAM_ASM_000638 /LENGTH=207 /DNA_ID=CAMNT_0006597341 /DNA_START=39 /DNA_END=662 /DNA_ORIENTATION=+
MNILTTLFCLLLVSISTATTTATTTTSSSSTNGNDEMSLSLYDRSIADIEELSTNYKDMGADEILPLINHIRDNYLSLQGHEHGRDLQIGAWLYLYWSTVTATLLAIAYIAIDLLPPICGVSNAGFQFLAEAFDLTEYTRLCPAEAIRFPGCDPDEALRQRLFFCNVVLNAAGVVVQLLSLLTIESDCAELCDQVYSTFCELCSEEN